MKIVSEQLIVDATSGVNPRRALDEKEVAQGLHFYYANSQELLDDAWLLAKNGRLSRAISLTILALEELSKVPKLHDFYVRLVAKRLTKKDLTKPWQGLWRSLASHGEKQETIEVYGKKSVERKESIEEFKEVLLPYKNFFPKNVADRLDNLKQRCFYVDYVGSSFSEPRHVSSNSIFDYIYSLAIERLYSFGSWHGDLERSLQFIKEQASYSLRLAECQNDINKLQRLLELRAEFDDKPPSLHESIASLDLLYWAAHRSSSLVPDYVSFKMEGVRVISKLNRSASFRAINVVVDALRERFDVDGMPLTSHRHWSMLKLMRSLSEFAVGEGILRQRHYDAIFKKA